MALEFREWLDQALAHFRHQVLEAHEQYHPPEPSIPSDTGNSPTGEPTPRRRKKKQNTKLAFEFDSLKGPTWEEEILRPPLSQRPTLIMALEELGEPKEESQEQFNGSTESEHRASDDAKDDSKENSGDSKEQSGDSKEQSGEGSLPGSRRDSQRDSNMSRRSHEEMMTPQECFERTMTRETLNSVLGDMSAILRARLGVQRKLVSGEELYDTAVSLGLTRFSLEDTNVLVNRLADFVDLELEHRDVRLLKRASTTVGRRSAHRDKMQPHVDPMICKPIWRWPEEQAIVTDFWRNRLVVDQPQRNWNVVPFRALALAFTTDVDHRRVFGSSLKHFNAMKEILSASDTNRLVAELTFVRINDLAAPQTARDPFLFLEPFVALLIICNAILLGVQTDERVKDWAGWPWIEVCFTIVMFGEALFRYWVLGRRNYFCGPDSSWNYFDIFLLITSVVDLITTQITEGMQDSPTQLLRACRLARLTRMFRVFRLKMIKELQLMIKGLVGGLRTLVLAFVLLFLVLYVIAVFATITIGQSEAIQNSTDETLFDLFRNVPATMFTAFRCYSGECISETGMPVALLLYQKFGLVFVFLYVSGYLLVTMGIFNVILAVYVDITMKAARENEARTSEQHERESIRVARLTRELVKKFKVAHEMRQRNHEEDDELATPSNTARQQSTAEEEHDKSDEIEISKELFLLVIQDRQVQNLMDDLDLPKDRANLFEALDADGSGTLHLAELAQGLLKVRGELKKTDTVATLLATKAVYANLELLTNHIEGLRKDLARAAGDKQLFNQKLPHSIFSA